MTEILFYHLTKKRLEDVLPSLLETCLNRSWRVGVQAGSRERLQAIDSLLWTYRDDGFLPHGFAGDAGCELQPICLALDDENPNDAKVRFFVEGANAEKPVLENLDRAVIMFDGRDEEALAAARAQWATIKDAGFAPTYWQQNEQGKWEKQAG